MAPVLEPAACKLKVMKYYSSGADLAKDMGVSLSVIEKAHEDHFQAAKKTETHPDDGPFPAYPSGKCWDEAAGRVSLQPLEQQQLRVD